MNSDPPIIKISKLNFSYNDNPVLENIRYLGQDPAGSPQGDQLLLQLLQSPAGPLVQEPVSLDPAVKHGIVKIVQYGCGKIMKRIIKQPAGDAVSVIYGTTGTADGRGGVESEVCEQPACCPMPGRIQQDWLITQLKFKIWR